MTTLKLKPGAAAPSKTPGKSPVRRADPAKRSRTSAPEYVKAPRVEIAEAKPAPAVQAERKPRPAPAKPGAAKPAAKRESHQAVAANKKPYAKKEERPRQFADRDTPRRGGKARDGFEQGTFNQDRNTNPKFSPKPAPSQPELPRLSKRMAELGLCSRREADDFIANGWVTVNGEVVDVLGTRVAPDAEIKVSKEAQKHQSEIVTILLHKPVGYVSGQAEDGYEPAVVLVNPENHWDEDPTQIVFKRGHLRGLAPAGRLDIDSTGLLVLTQDGRVARQLIGEDSTTEKEYLVRVTGTLSEDGLKKLNFGLSLDGVKLKPAKVSWQNEDQLRFVLREGRKRQIRRMCELVGLTVVGLKRVRIGSVVLGKLPVGTWRYLRPGERF
ncbi:pseudouridine synthase [Methylobacillus methanolivorans]|uniref:Dual-specificity RNA pseudouridine synthase RluF n=1 Tax=Methylobacillus methanolivorans TaxID=1848927 RepID=A0ABW8GMY1_9PROT